MSFYNALHPSPFSRTRIWIFFIRCHGRMEALDSWPPSRSLCYPQPSKPSWIQANLLWQRYSFNTIHFTDRYVKLEYNSKSSLSEATKLLVAEGYEFVEGIMFCPKCHYAWNTCRGCQLEAGFMYPYVIWHSSKFEQEAFVPDQHRFQFLWFREYRLTRWTVGSCPGSSKLTGQTWTAHWVYFDAGLLPP